MDLLPEEPAAVDWAPVPDAALRDLVLSRLPGGRGLVLVDGRSGGGKTTVAARLARLLDAALVHTDDIAWWVHPVEWDDILLREVVEPWSRGESVAYRSPVWEERGRPGAVEVPAVPVLVVEGVGAGRASLAEHAEVVVWVQSDHTEARRRGIARDLVQEGRTPEEAESFWDEWAQTEDPFLAADRPWERADLVVCGTPGIGGAPASDDTVVGRLP